MTRTNTVRIVLAIALGAAGACNDVADTGIDELDLPDAGDSDADADDAGISDAGPADLSGKPSFAVSLSDYESAGVAIMDGEGKVLSPKYISSGTEVSGLSSALHGDITLPTQPCQQGLLTVVARSGGDYILQVDLKQSKVVRQIATQGAAGEAAYKSNPQDILCLGDGQALVSRFAPNLDPNASELDLGDDILRMNLESEERKSRIDLTAMRGLVEGVDADGNAEQQTAYARPGSIVRVGDHAVVALARLTKSYVAAEGMLAIVDLKTDKVTGFELPTLRNCAVLVPVADRDDAVVLSCAGSPYGAAATAGLLLVSVDADGKAKVEQTYQADAKLPVIYAAPVSIGGTRVVAVATGSFKAMTPDTAYVIDLDNGETTELIMSGSAGELGVGAGGAYRPDTGLLAIPDGGKGIHLFEVSDDDVKETKLLPFDQALPVRGIRPLVTF